MPTEKNEQISGETDTSAPNWNNGYRDSDSEASADFAAHAEPDQSLASDWADLIQASKGIGAFPTRFIVGPHSYDPQSQIYRGE